MKPYTCHMSHAACHVIYCRHKTKGLANYMKKMRIERSRLWALELIRTHITASISYLLACLGIFMFYAVK